MPTAKKISVRLITLGCPKNLVDSEVMGGLLAEKDFFLLPEGSESDVGIVNTCGFIEASKKESIDAILALANEKKEGKLKLLIVAGCLSQRYATELPKLLPEVDAFIGTGDFSHLPSVIREKLNGVKRRNFILDPTQELPTALSPRIAGTPTYSRYIKLSEGCSHACSFCTIPLMRGGLKSRAENDILEGIRRGVGEGTKEFNLIAQDLNEYGRDLAEHGSLYGLLEKLGEVQGDFWVRLLYMYPLQFPDRLIRLMKDHPHVIPYVDIPLQHIHDRILKSMNRGSSSAYIYRLIEKLKKEIPGMILRTTFIAGYPGETDEEFGSLLKFIREMEFDRLGVFTFSQEEQTPSATLAGQVPEAVKAARRDLLMTTQQGISRQKNGNYIGKTMKVLYEGVEGGIATGRFYGQAPEIDGDIIIDTMAAETPPIPGTFTNVKITGTLDYDLVGEIGSA